MKIEFVLSAPVDGAGEDPIAIAPKVPLSFSWPAPDRVVAVPLEPLQPNTRYTARLRPSAVGSRLRLAGPAVTRFHTRLFAVDLIEADSAPNGAGEPQIERIRIDFTHAVAPEDLTRYVVIRADDEDRTDVAFSVDDRAPCERCVLRLSESMAVAHLEVLPELSPMVGGRPLEKAVARRLDPLQPAPFKLLEARPIQQRGRHSLLLAGTRRLADPVPASAVRIEPAVDHEVRADGRFLVVEGTFKPETDYAISVESMAARDGAPLVESFERTVRIPPLHGELAVQSDEPILSPTASEPVVVQTVGVRRLALKTFSVPIDNLVHVLSELSEPAEPSFPSLGQWMAVAPVGVEGPIDGLSRTAVRLPDPERPGLRLLEVKAEDQPWLVDRRWIQAGWVLSAKRGIGRTRVQVLSAAKRRPIRGVQIRLRTASNRSVGPQRTNSLGVAVLAHEVDDPVELVIATKLGDTAILDLRSTSVRDDAAPLSDGAGREAFLLPSQDRYRPRDKVSVLVITREAGLAPPTAGLPVKVRLVGPTGREWAAQEVQLWRAGGARSELTFPSTAPFGSYTLQASAEGAVIGRAKVVLQAQRNMAPATSVVGAVATSTGSPRLSWTPERPKAGRTLRVRWLAPAAGWVTVSLESTEVLTEVRRKVTQGPATFSLTVPRAATPGAHLVVTFEPTGQSYASSGRVAAVGDRVWVEVGRRRTLPVRIEVPPGPYRSGASVPVKVRGRTGSKDTFAVVRVVTPDALDEKLASERDGFRFFHRMRPPSWRTHVPTGGFRQTDLVRLSAPTPSLARTLEPNGSLMTDPYRLTTSGEKVLPVVLPAQQGQLQVEAVVWSDGRIGRATATIEVRDPLSITAAAPQVLAEGDTVELPVSVFRGVAGEQAVQLTATADGGLQIIGAAEQSLDVAPGTAGEAVVKLTATAAGRVELRAAAGSEAAVWRRRISVRPVGQPQVTAVSGQARAGKALTLNWPPLAGRSRVVLGALPVYELGAAVTRLARLDRDDLETVAARALARQVVGDLSRPKKGRKAGEPTVRRSAPVAGAWPTSLTQLDRCLSSDGPRAWPNGPTASAASVVMAGHAAVLAAKRGRKSPRLAAWLRAVRAVTRAGATEPRTIAHGQWVLALGDKPDDTMLQQLQTQWASRPPDLASGVALAAALTLTGKTRQAAPFLKFSDVATLSAEDAAFVLAALADVAPNHRAVSELSLQLVSSLSGERGLGPRTDALAVLGLGRLEAAQEGKRAYSATVKIGEQTVDQVKGPFGTAVGDFDDGARTGGDVQLQVAGPFGVYASLVVEGAPPGPDDLPLPVKLQLLDSGGQAATRAQVGDLLTLAVDVGPLTMSAPDLRIAVPIPSGLTVIRVELPSPQARTAPEPGMLSFDLAASARAHLQVKLQVAATFAGEFVLGPATVSSALRPSQAGTSEYRRLLVNATP